MTAYESGRADGIRQAVAWLQADYPYGDMPDWRQQGVDWINDHASNERIARAATHDRSAGRWGRGMSRQQTWCCASSDHCYDDGHMRPCHPEQVAADASDDAPAVVDLQTPDDASSQATP